jgi:hypothetical protein
MKHRKREVRLLGSPIIAIAALDGKLHFDGSIPRWRFRVKALREALVLTAPDAPISFRPTTRLQRAPRGRMLVS